MIIEEKDFNIKFEHGCYILYLLKNKKELKEDSLDKYKVGGYYIEIVPALKEVIRFRHSKKYTGGESFIDLYNNLKELQSTKKLFNTLINSIYDPIIELRKKLFTYD